MQIGDNYLNNGHLPCHNGRVWQLAIAVSLEVPDAGRRRPHTSQTTSGGVSGRPRRLAKDVTLMSLHAAYYIL